MYFPSTMRHSGRSEKSLVQCGSYQGLPPGSCSSHASHSHQDAAHVHTNNSCSAWGEDVIQGEVLRSEVRNSLTS